MKFLLAFLAICIVYAILKLDNEINQKDIESQKIKDMLRRMRDEENQ